MKNEGGHFAPKLGGQFKFELHGQYHWNLHPVSIRFILATILSVTFISNNKDNYFILNVKFFLYFT